MQSLGKVTLSVATTTYSIYLLSQSSDLSFLFSVIWCCPGPFPLVVVVSVSPRLQQTSLYHHQLRLLRLLIRTFALSLPKSLCRLNSGSSSLSHFRLGLFLGCDAFHITNSLCLYASISHSRMCGLFSHLISKLSPSPDKPCNVAVVEIATAVSWLLEHRRSYMEKGPSNGKGVGRAADMGYNGPKVEGNACDTSSYGRDASGGLLECTVFGDECHC